MEEKETRIFDLPNVGDYRKSFYGKAIQMEDSKGKHLISYGSNICTIKPNGKVEIHTNVDKWDSNTSMRHLKSFLEFNGKQSGSKAEIMKLYL